MATTIVRLRQIFVLSGAPFMDPGCSNLGFVFLVGPASGVPPLESVLDPDAGECVHFDKPAGVLRRLRAETAVDLVILAPDTSFEPYAELCRHVKFDARTAFVPVIFLVPLASADGCAGLYEAGADDCILLPASSKEIRLRLSNALRMKRATDVLEDSTAVITSLAAAIEGRDSYTHGHVERVSVYSMEIGKRLGVDGVVLAALKIGGIVHDVGKVAIPDSLLNKPGKLDDVEMELVRRHPIVGYHILEPLRTFRSVLPVIRWHHERPNGRGYPDGLAGDQLPLTPRIVAVADVFDALSTNRPYRPALSTSRCREILSAAAEDEDLDPHVVAALLDILGGRVPTLVSTPMDAAIS